MYLRSVLLVTIVARCDCDILEIDSSQPMHFQQLLHTGSYYTSLQTIVDILRTKYFGTFNDSHRLLNHFNKYCVPMKKVNGSQQGKMLLEEKKRQIFIVIEQLFPAVSHYVYQKFSDLLHAYRLRHATGCLRDFRWNSSAFTELRRLYNALSVYALSYGIQQYWRDYVCVAEGFWHRKAIYALVRDYKNSKIPSKYLDWPEDLIQPDLVFALYMPLNSGMLRGEIYHPETRQYIKNLTILFKRIKTPRIIFVDANLPPHKIIEKMRKSTKEFALARNLSYKNPYVGLT